MAAAGRKRTAKGGNGPVVAFAVVLGAAFFSIPFIAHYTKQENFTSKEQPLNASQIRRGAYLNSGSRDAGVDPDWDFRTGTWHGRRTVDPPKPKHAGEPKHTEE